MGGYYWLSNLCHMHDVGPTNVFVSQAGWPSGVVETPCKQVGQKFQAVSQPAGRMKGWSVTCLLDLPCGKALARHRYETDMDSRSNSRVAMMNAFPTQPFAFLLSIPYKYLRANLFLFGLFGTKTFSFTMISHLTTYHN